MTSHNFKSPPRLDNSANYEEWEKAVALWQRVTDIPANKPGAALVLALPGKTQSIALELPVIELDCEDGVKNVLDKLG